MAIKIKEFKDIISDRIFKYYFKNKNTLIDFLNSYFEYIGSTLKVKEVNVEPQSYIGPDNEEIKDYYGDILAKLDNDEYILIEAYTSFTRREYKKSNCYISRVYSNQMHFKDKNYLKCKKCTCLNLMSGNYQRKNNDLINRYITKNVLTNKALDESEIEMVLIRLDLLKNYRYDNSNKRFIRWLQIINAKSTEEMRKYAKGDKVMNESIDYLEYYHNNLDHGIQDIIDEEVFLAREETTKETKLNIAKSLLSLNIDIEDIKKATGLSEKTNKKVDGIKL